MLKNKLKTIPNLPGCYLWLDKKDKIIYVGKAKDLKKRMLSYFNKALDTKTQSLVNEIKAFKIQITNNEIESLLLEFNLIKKYQPKYNIKLRDRFHLPYIVITKDKHPQVKIVNLLNTYKKNQYREVFGPFHQNFGLTTIIEIINLLYPLKTCLNKPKTKACLYYHLGQCLGGCFKDVDPKIYQQNINLIKDFFRGKVNDVTIKLKEKMLNASNLREYELANNYKKKLELVTIFKQKQAINLKDKISADFINIVIKKNIMGLAIIHVREGFVVGNFLDIFHIGLNPKDDLTTYLIDFYQNQKSVKLLYVANNILNEKIKSILKIELIHPLKGQKHTILNLCKVQAREYLKTKELSLKTRDNILYQGIIALENHINTSINTIWMFDNAFDQKGTSVSSRIVFENYKFNKNQYRLYKTKQYYDNDYDILKEVIYRNLYKNITHNLALPDLIIVDGGLGQYQVVKELLKTFDKKTSLIALKKNSHHKTESMIFNAKEIKLNQETDLYLFLKKLQDESHRFTINYFRKKVAKKLFE